MQPTPKDVHIDQALSNVSIKYTNAAFVGEKLFTPLEVNKDSDLYFIYGKQNFKLFNTLRAPGTRAKQVEYTIEKSSTYLTLEHALEKGLPQEVIDNADDPLKPEIDDTEMLTEMLLLDLEKTIADIATNASSYASGHSETLSGTNQWSDYVNSNPLKKVEEIKSIIHQKIFRYPNVMIVSQPVHAELVNHPIIQDRIKYTQLGVATTDLLAALFGIKNYLVAGAGYDGAIEGQPENMQYIWGKNVILAYVEPNPGIKKLSFGYIFRKKGYRKVKKWYQDAEESAYLRVADKYDVRVVCPDAGFLLKSVVA